MKQQMPVDLSRRRLLRLAGNFTTVAFYATFVRWPKGFSRDGMAGLLEELRCDGRLRDVAKKVIDHHELRRLIADSSHVFTESIDTASSRQEVRAKLARLSERDFQAGRFVFIDGWPVSATEGHLCLAAHFPEQVFA